MASSELANADGKNSGTIKCLRCDSIILSSNSAKFHKHEDGIFLQHIKKANEQGDSKGETLHDYWLVHDIFAFENVGFCNLTNGIKYLACADCEIGPIGAQFVNNMKDILVAVDRVKMVST